MLVLVSGTTKTVRRLADKWPDHLGILLTPRNRNSMASVTKLNLPWACDNGAFSGLDAESFRRMLRRVSEANLDRLLWITCPDKIADATTTLQMFEEWHKEVRAAGPIAFVGQDGQEDLVLPWEKFDCLFIGGSTRWKLSEAAGSLIQEAKDRRKHVHMGRVNSRRRLVTAMDAGCDSVDGSSLSMFGDKYIHVFCRWCRELEAQGTLRFG